LPVAAEPGAPAPAALALAAPYPNPATGALTLAFTLPAPGPARLAVYDALGRTVAVVLDGALPAGAHAVGFDAGALPAGVYLVRLEAGGEALTRRLTRLRCRTPPRRGSSGAGRVVASFPPGPPPLSHTLRDGGGFLAGRRPHQAHGPACLRPDARRPGEPLAHHPHHLPLRPGTEHELAGPLGWCDLRLGERVAEAPRPVEADEP